MAIYYNTCVKSNVNNSSNMLPTFLSFLEDGSQEAFVYTKDGVLVVCLLGEQLVCVFLQPWWHHHHL
jgi:hypothetical protein